jgi:TusA-related sulfurtransferase
MSLQQAAVTRLVEAIAARDVGAITGALAPDTRFRYLIPPGAGEVVGAGSVADKFLEWFGDLGIVGIANLQVEAVADRTSARYRFVVGERQPDRVIEQQTFLDLDEEGRIAAIDLLCSGFRPAPVDHLSAARHEFDAGELGCADGLAQEFRRRILAIPMGEVLVIQTSDPAAKEDLPPLARLMGHKVLSIEPSQGGRLLITVERGR